MVDGIESDLGLITYTFENSPSLMDAFKSPLIPADVKRKIVRDIFADKVHEITLSYLDLLITKRREEAVLATEEEYIDLANEARGILVADVTSALKLTEDQEWALKAKLGKMTGKSVHLQKTIDPSIIGGVIVRIEDRVIDGSIKGRLAAIKEKLIS
jgi:F-type H+-transporting ATPase subunit delta